MNVVHRIGGIVFDFRRGTIAKPQSDTKKADTKRHQTTSDQPTGT
jgi:hypothetical protein